jgi:5-methyltetrahydrofolate--homocysteine methyltransferase
MTPIESLRNAVLNGDAKSARTITESALGSGADALELITQGMMPAMDEAGRRFECSEFFVPELLLSARAMKGALELIRPILAKTGAEPSGRVVIGTVRGDLHDIGKNLVAAMLEGAGFEVIDLGVNVPPDRFVETVRTRNVRIVALSALLTTTMGNMRATIEAFKQAGLRDHVHILIGGAPVTQKYADEIGADGYGDSAPGAVALVRKAAAARASGVSTAMMRSS